MLHILTTIAIVYIVYEVSIFLADLLEGGSSDD